MCNKASSRFESAHPLLISVINFCSFSIVSSCIVFDVSSRRKHVTSFNRDNRPPAVVFVATNELISTPPGACVFLTRTTCPSDRRALCTNARRRMDHSESTFLNSTSPPSSVPVAGSPSSLLRVSFQVETWLGDMCWLDGPAFVCSASPIGPPIAPNGSMNRSLTGVAFSDGHAASWSTHPGVCRGCDAATWRSTDTAVSHGISRKSIATQLSHPTRHHPPRGARGGVKDENLAHRKKAPPRRALEIDIVVRAAAAFSPQICHSRFLCFRGCVLPRDATDATRRRASSSSAKSIQRAASIDPTRSDTRDLRRTK